MLYYQQHFTDEKTEAQRGRLTTPSCHTASEQYNQNLNPGSLAPRPQEGG